ncbi:MAG: CheR family methyltransferase [Pseudobdellovibrionaceae bacterium]
MDQRTLEEILILVYKFTGMTMAANKRDLLKYRLSRRLKALGITDFSQYVNCLQEDKKEAQEFINLVTTHETYFFRTQCVWDYFNGSFLPAWTSRNSGKTLRAWSAAASTGEEAYTIAMCCEEFCSGKFKYQVFATDISTDVINYGKAGVYKGRSVEKLKSLKLDLLNKYFDCRDELYTVNSSLKEKVLFDIHNLLENSKKENFYDIVFLRNVLIYFEVAEQEQILKKIRNTMRDNGVLVLGESETLLNLNSDFQFKKPLIYEKINR